LAHTAALYSAVSAERAAEGAAEHAKVHAAEAASLLEKADREGACGCIYLFSIYIITEYFILI
tara:strand:+ start:406 stop:594 length:189 start_codon:yes stop_codon:yes gene_type:complete